MNQCVYYDKPLFMTFLNDLSGIQNVKIIHELIKYPVDYPNP